MRNHLIPRVMTKLLVPAILLFALYVQFHGDFGPGGGFQAGVIFASGFILYGLIFGADMTRRVITPRKVTFFIAAGLLLYAGVGLVSIVLGGNYLDYGVFAEDFAAGQRLGIMLVELGVGITVAAVMIKVFNLFMVRMDR
jgi:multicomponent Na+:H+ antiporter subunit B